MSFYTKFYFKNRVKYDRVKYDRVKYDRVKVNFFNKKLSKGYLDYFIFKGLKFLRYISKISPLKIDRFLEHEVLIFLKRSPLYLFLKICLSFFEKFNFSYIRFNRFLLIYFIRFFISELLELRIIGFIFSVFKKTITFLKTFKNIFVFFFNEIVHFILICFIILLKFLVSLSIFLFFLILLT